MRATPTAPRPPPGSSSVTNRGLAEESSMDKDANDGREPKRKHLPKLTKKKLDSFLASICEAAGMTGKTPKSAKKPAGKSGLTCQGPCEKSQWRAHLDIPSGILCVSADWSKNRGAEKHRDVTVAITYLNERGKREYSEMIFCDSEVRWLMETLWHAPIWD